MSTKWNSDPSHSELNFKAKHMMITNVSGTIGKFDVQAESDDDQLTNVKVTAVAEMNTVTTGDEKRDGHLLSADFFDVEKYPHMKFVSTKMENGKLHGDLTIRNITKPVVLDVEIGGITKDPWGNMRAGISLEGRISRKEWELTWNMALETGGLLVSDEVRITGEVQMVKAV